MKSFFTLPALLACAGANALAQSWTTVTIDPPPTKCCETKWTSDAECNVIQQAINDAQEYTIISLKSGTYCNKKFHEGGITAPGGFKHQALAKILNTNNLKIEAADGAKPLLKVDGWSGIQIKNVHGITIKGLEIEGPA